eukprot:TRINITY_DN2315_c1_g2_i1.p1 TRINITY_DN2315_c1_g2~~TRINITY_DN2315_c1_g2_i1.p1  ORF type:complete len:287 (+),score=16.26 TRINITY_DN2315_c1_g2_i1:80-940(+)
MSSSSVYQNLPICLILRLVYQACTYVVSSVRYNIMALSNTLNLTHDMHRAIQPFIASSDNSLGELPGEEVSQVARKRQRSGTGRGYIDQNRLEESRRAKNREAARRFRQRRAEQFRDMDIQIQRLEDDNLQLHRKCLTLSTYLENLKGRQVRFIDQLLRKGVDSNIIQESVMEALEVEGGIGVLPRVPPPPTIDNIAQLNDMFRLQEGSNRIIDKGDENCSKEQGEQTGEIIELGQDVQIADLDGKIQAGSEGGNSSGNSSTQEECTLPMFNLFGASILRKINEFK